MIGIRQPQKRPAAVLLLLLMANPVTPLAMGRFVAWSAGGSPPAVGLANSITQCLYGWHQLRPTEARVGFLVPTFTLTPYGNFEDSFYAFYTKYGNAIGNITHNLSWLSTPVSADWSAKGNIGEKPLYDFMVSWVPLRCGLQLGRNLQFTDDVAVDAGALFAGGKRQIDVLILGHEEYVTNAEYGQLKEFVASGGRLVVMCGNTFWGEVSYNRTSRTETFVIGHGFAYNGRTAWRTGYEPFDSDAAGWFGSTFANGIYNLRGAVLNATSDIGGNLARATTSGTAFTTYSWPHDEVNYLRNRTGTEVIATFYTSVHTKAGQNNYSYPLLSVDAYRHQYGKGEVICLAVFGESLIAHDFAAQFFLIYGAEEGFGNPRWA